MTPAHVQLPDDLYERAKRFGAEHDLSLAETVRRALELLLEGAAAAEEAPADWELPIIDVGELKTPLERLREFLGEESEMGWQLSTFDGGGIKVPLEDLRAIIADEESLRSLLRE